MVKTFNREGKMVIGSRGRVDKRKGEKNPTLQATKVCRVCGAKLVTKGGRWVVKDVCDYCKSGGKNVRVHG